MYEQLKTAVASPLILTNLFSCFQLCDYQISGENVLYIIFFWKEIQAWKSKY